MRSIAILSLLLMPLGISEGFCTSGADLIPRDATTTGRQGTTTVMVEVPLRGRQLRLVAHFSLLQLPVRSVTAQKQELQEQLL